VCEDRDEDFGDQGSARDWLADREQIIENTVSDVNFVDQVTGSVRNAVVGSYVDGLWWSHGKNSPS
jgi:hypothetical protein